MPKKKPTIIFLDDKECSNFILDSKLILNNFNVVMVNDGKKALDKIFETKPDLVVSDVVIPGSDIFNVMKKMKNNPETKNIPVMAFTTLCTLDDKREVLKSGACDYLLKHECSPKSLVDKIKKRLKK